ncbi:MAG: hypothetical protein ACI4AB_05735 [Acetatifactor sp.]
MDRQNILEQIQDADMVLVGLGEDFDNTRCLRQNEAYENGRELLEEAGYRWVLPAWMEYCSYRLGENSVRLALEKLEKLLHNKNYFIVSVATNRVIDEIPWKKEKLVMPCGSCRKKQCVKGCSGELMDVTEEDKAALEKAFQQLFEGKFPETGILGLGKCSQCGGDMILNTTYAESYNESGYLEKWQLYTKWLQGTLNHKLLILELGVSLRFPTVVRWPFEKVAFFNNKASFFRINERLYQITEELASKGVGISRNAIDWINDL